MTTGETTTAGEAGHNDRGAGPEGPAFRFMGRSAIEFSSR
jgi:hypothetical protein